MTIRDAPPANGLMIPDTAPFSVEQRAWLNGFFAGVVSLDGAGVTALSPEQSAALMPGVLPRERGPLDDGDEFWTGAGHLAAIVFSLCRCGLLMITASLTMSCWNTTWKES